MNNQQDNYNNLNIGNERSQGLLQFRKDDFYNYEATDNDGFHYMLAMHKSASLLLFAKIAEKTTESQMGAHCIWVDANSKGRYQILDQDHAAEVKLIPTDFVHGKCNHAIYYFSIYEEDVKNKLCADKPGAAEEQKLQELKSEIDLHLIRLVKLLIHDLENIEHITETTDNKLNLAIRNIVDNNNKFIPDFMKDDEEWLRLKFNSNSYYVDEIGGLQNSDNVSYYMAFHKTLKHVIFVRATGQEFKIKSNMVHRLYISEDDGLGRYKVQTNEGAISKQFFVPAGYVESCHNIFIGLFNDFKKLQEESNAYSRQTIWCKLQDDAIHLINQILGELNSDLQPEIENSLEHSVMLMPFSSVIRNPRNFDEFYKRVVEAEKRMRLERKGKTYFISLVIFNRRHRTTFIIHINNLENDIFSLHEKVRILISKYDPDYYVVVSEAWKPKNLEIQQRISSNYRYGNIIKLPSHEKVEILTFIGKTKK